MENGKIVLEGTSKELSNNEDVKEFYLGGAKGERRSFKISSLTRGETLALEKEKFNSPYYDESETLDRELREEKTFNEFSKRLKKIALSKGWMELLKKLIRKY